MVLHHHHHLNTNPRKVMSALPPSTSAQPRSACSSCSSCSNSSSNAVCRPVAVAHRDAVTTLREYPGDVTICHVDPTSPPHHQPVATCRPLARLFFGLVTVSVCCLGGAIVATTVLLRASSSTSSALETTQLQSLFGGSQRTTSTAARVASASVGRNESVLLGARLEHLLIAVEELSEQQRRVTRRDAPVGRSRRNQTGH
jgi:hypothetical protein